MLKTLRLSELQEGSCLTLNPEIETLDLILYPIYILLYIQTCYQRVQYPRIFWQKKLQIILCRLDNLMKWTEYEKICLSIP